jgi:hypothetical protein
MSPKLRNTVDRDAQLISRKLRSVLRTKKIRIPKGGYLLRTVRGKLTVQPL